MEKSISMKILNVDITIIYAGPICFSPHNFKGKGSLITVPYLTNDYMLDIRGKEESAFFFSK